MKNLMPLAALCLTILMSCSKDDVSPTTTNNSSQNNYFPLAIGNYWIYELYTLDTLGNETLNSGTDSVYVKGDTIISGQHYFTLNGSTFLNHVLGSILRSDNKNVYRYNSGSGTESVVVSLNNLGSSIDQEDFVIANTTLNSSTVVRPRTVNKTVSSGTYNCHEAISTLMDTSGTFSYFPRNESRFFNSAVGLVAGQYTFLSSPNKQELRLVRYQID